MEVIYSPAFKRAYKKMPDFVRERAREVEKIFKTDPFHSLLRTHKLHGRFADRWAFSITYNYRIVFSFVTDKTVHFLDIGNHDIYQ